MTRVIAVASGKGGTGKTVVTANLGVALAEMGKDVTLIDIDLAMANLELVLGMEGMPTTLQDVLAGEAKVEDAIYTGPGGVKFIPAGLSFDRLKSADPDRIRDVVEFLLDKTEFVFLDCPSGLSKITLIGLECAEELLLVVNPDISSVTDALKTKIIAEKLKTKLTGIVVNKWTKSGFEMDRKEIERIIGGEVLAVIPDDPEVRKAVSFGQPVVLRSPDCPASKAIRELASKIAGVEVGEKEEKKKGFFGFLRR